MPDRTNDQYTAAAMEDLASALPAAAFTPRTVTTSPDHELWSTEAVLALIIAFLAIEWFLRKRNGML